MADTDINVSHIAKLANLPIKKENLSRFQDEIPQILEYVNQIQELDLSQVKPTNQVTQQINRWRLDTITPSLSQDEALKNAPRTHNGYFVVKAILNHE